MIGTIVAVVTTALLATLFAAAVTYQWTSDADLASRPTVLGLQYRYHLFSPRPVRTDLHLVVRDFDANGLPRPCRELPLTKLRAPLDGMWNPGKRRFLPLRAMSRHLARLCADLDDAPAAVQVSRPYLDLLGVVSALPSDGSSARQFLLVARFGTDPDHDPEVVFCSAVHRLPALPTRAAGGTR